MHTPADSRMPVFTAAPLPLLYGWRTTRAPARAACAAVSSVEPSSTTRISRQASIAGELRDRGANRVRRRFGHQSRGAVVDEFERAARVARRHDRLACE